MRTMGLSESTVGSPPYYSLQQEKERFDENSSQKSCIVFQKLSKRSLWNRDENKVEAGRSFGYAEIGESWINFTTVPHTSFMISGKYFGQVFRKISSALLASLGAQVTSQTFKGKLQAGCWSPWIRYKMSWPMLNAFKYPASTVEATHLKVFTSVLHFHTCKILCSYLYEPRRTNL